MGMGLWPSASLLAKYLWQHQLQFSSRKVLELGAGVGLPSIVAARLGCKVIATDMSDKHGVLRNLVYSAALNQLDIVVVCNIFWFRHKEITTFEFLSCCYSCYCYSILCSLHPPKSNAEMFHYNHSKGWIGALWLNPYLTRVLLMWFLVQTCCMTQNVSRQHMCVSIIRNR